MRNNKIKIFLLILIGITGFLIYKSQKVMIIDIDSNKTYPYVTKKPINIKNQKEKSTNKNISLIINEEKDESNHEQVNTFFDNDPVVDREIISQKFKHCSQLLFFIRENKYKKNKSHIYTKLKQSKPDYYDKQLNHCIQLNTQHPEYRLDQSEKIKNRQPTTFLGRLMSDEEFSDSEIENNIDSIKKEIIHADPNLMLTFYADLTYFNFVPELSYTIQSQQHDYGLTIGKYAKILFACRLGADCGEFSTIVFETCMFNNDMCSNNIEELIKTKFSNGQQADIELAYQHLVNYYNVDE